MKCLILLSLFPLIALARHETERLIHHLLNHYEKHIKPEGQVKVSIGFNPKRLEYIEGMDLLSLTSWNVMSWTDSRLAWNPEDFNGIKVIHLPEWQVWVPDVVNYYALDKPVYFGKYEAIVDNDGSVMVIPAMKQKVFCMNENKGQKSINCTLKLGSWHYSEADIDLVALDSDFSEPLMSPNAIKKVEATRVEGKYPGIPDIYPYLKISILFEMSNSENMYEFVSMNDQDLYKWK